MAAAAATKPEGNNGTTAFTFTVTRTGDHRMAVGAAWQVAGNGADATDFAGGVLPTGTVSLAAGQASKTITVAAQGDRTVEPDEGFTLTLSTPTGGASIGTATAAGTILNEDVDPPLLALSAAAETVAEGTLEGSIAESPRGDEGFGYDPIFVPLGDSRTVAELGDAWKAEHSHRAVAARALARRLAASHKL